MVTERFRVWHSTGFHSRTDASAEQFSALSVCVPAVLGPVLHARDFVRAFAHVVQRILCMVVCGCMCVVSTCVDVCEWYVVCVFNAFNPTDNYYAIMLRMQSYV